MGNILKFIATEYAHGMIVNFAVGLYKEYWKACWKTFYRPIGKN